MDNGDNNQVDLLLRGLAKREGDAASSASSAAFARQNHRASEHLDADELNSYTENALPPLARARYTEHLADCESCRSLVARLSQAPGAVSRHQILAEETHRLTFWQKAAAFFSPQVLRYAVPALALLGVITVSLLALRQQRRSDFITQNQSPAPTESVTKTQTEVFTNNGATPQQPASSATITESPRETNATKGEKGDVAQTSKPSDAVSTTAESAAKEAAPEATAKVKPFFAPEPASVPASPAQPKLADAEADKRLQKDQSAEREAQEVRRRDEKVRANDEIASNRSSPSRTETFGYGGRKVAGLSSVSRSKSDDTDNKKSAEEAETRTVSGRRFRREGNTWVDTTFEPSRTVTNVTRGSKQFRALAADEPGFSAIAEQLRGQVIVVWKGRAYRIH